MRRFSGFAAVVGLCWLITVPVAFADPVTVTAGTLTATRPPLPGGSASLVGTRGFSLDARVTTGEGRVDVLTNCDPCLPGETLSIAGILSGAAFSGVATLDGQTFPHISGIGDPASIFMEFVGHSVLPAFQDADVVVTLPFTMMGFFNLPASQEVLRGQGLASVLLSPQMLADSPPEWRGQRVVYTFNQEQPIPEPSTMILVGAGLIMVARKVKRGYSLSRAS